MVVVATKNSKKKSSGGAVTKALASEFEFEFTLIVCLVSYNEVLYHT